MRERGLLSGKAKDREHKTGVLSAMSKRIKALLMIGGLCAWWLVAEKFLWRHEPKLVIEAQPQTASQREPERKPPDIEAAKRCIDGLDPDSVELDREILECAK